MLRMLGYIGTLKLAQLQPVPKKAGIHHVQGVFKTLSISICRKRKNKDVEQVNSLRACLNQEEINQSNMLLDSYFTTEFKALSDSTADSVVQLYLFHIWLLCVINLALSRMQS